MFEFTKWEIIAMIWLTLHHISYIPPSDSISNWNNKIFYKKMMSKIALLAMLNGMERNNIGQKRNAILPNVT